MLCIMKALDWMGWHSSKTCHLYMVGTWFESQSGI